MFSSMRFCASYILVLLIVSLLWWKKKETRNCVSRKIRPCFKRRASCVTCYMSGSLFYRGLSLHHLMNSKYDLYDTTRLLFRMFLAYPVATSPFVSTPLACVNIWKSIVSDSFVSCWKRDNNTNKKNDWKKKWIHWIFCFRLGECVVQYIDATEMLFNLLAVARTQNILKDAIGENKELWLIYIYTWLQMLHTPHSLKMLILLNTLLSNCCFSFFLAQQIHFVVAVSRAICAV